MTTKQRYQKKLAQRFDKIDHDERSRFGLMRPRLDRVADLDRARYDIIVAAGRIKASDRDWVRACERQLEQQRERQRREESEQHFGEMTRKITSWDK